MKEEKKKKFKVNKKYLLGVTLVVGVVIFFLLFSSVRAAIINTIFSNGEESSNINVTLTDAGSNASVYFEISRFVTVQNASMNVSGETLEFNVEGDWWWPTSPSGASNFEPIGIWANDSRIYLYGSNGDDSIVEYYFNGTLISYVNTAIGSSAGLHNNGTHWYTAPCCINNEGNITTIFPNGTTDKTTHITEIDDHIIGIAGNSSHIWLFRTNNNITEYSIPDLTHTGRSIDASGYQDGYIGFDTITNEYLYLINTTSNIIQKIDLSGNKITDSEHSWYVNTNDTTGRNEIDWGYIQQTAIGNGSIWTWGKAFGVCSSNYFTRTSDTQTPCSFPINQLYYNWTDLENVGIDIEIDGDNEFIINELNLTNSPQLFNYTNFTTSLQHYINITCTIDTCQIPINISTDSSGIVQLDAISIGTTPSRLFLESYPSANISETYYGNFNTTVFFDDGENPVVYLWYNGTYYGATQIEKENNNATYRVLLSIPLVTNPFNESRLFHWNITDSEITYTTDNQNHTVFRINVTNCTAPVVTPTLNFTIYDEIGGALISSDLDSTWSFWAESGDGSLTRSYNNGMDSQTNFSFCIYPSWANLTASATISYEADGYEPRGYHLANYNLDNDSENINLYLLSTGNATTFKLTVRDNSYLYYPNVIVRTLKYQVATDSFIEVESCSTDVDATCLTHLILEDVDYRFMVVRPNGTIIHTSGNFRAYCPQSNVFDQCLFTVLIPPALETFNYVWDEISGLSYAVTHDNVTEISSLTYSFNAGTVSYIRFQVSQSTTTICNTNSSAIAGVLTCDLTGYNGTVKRQVFLSRSDDLAIFTDYLDLSELWQTFGDAGLFFLILIVISIGAASVVTGSPMATLILVIAALGISVVTGIGGIGIAAFIMLAVAAAFIIFKLRQ